MNKYLYHGHVCFVEISPDFGPLGATRYCTLWQDERGEYHKIRLSALPDRARKSTAQKDLDKYMASIKRSPIADEKKIS